MARVLSVGQCDFDHGTIARTLRQGFGAEVVAAHDGDEALRALRAGGYALVLVNRVLDSDGSSGLDLIRLLRADPDLEHLPVMLVSNYPTAQREAETLGALPGFGKAELSSPGVRDRLAAVLAPSG